MIGNESTDFLNLEHLGSALGFVEEIQNVVEKLSLFDGFTTSDYSKLCEYMECFGARKDVTLISEGARSSTPFLQTTRSSALNCCWCCCSNGYDNWHGGARHEAQEAVDAGREVVEQGMGTPMAPGTPD